MIECAGVGGQPGRLADPSPYAMLPLRALTVTAISALEAGALASLVLDGTDRKNSLFPDGAKEERLREVTVSAVGAARPDRLAAARSADRSSAPWPQSPSQ